MLKAGLPKIVSQIAFQDFSQCHISYGNPRIDFHNNRTARAQNQINAYKTRKPLNQLTGLCNYPKCLPDLRMPIGDSNPLEQKLALLRYKLTVET